MNGTFIAGAKTALITGANGFVGRLLTTAMLKQGWRIRAALRLPHQMPAGMEPVIIGAIDDQTKWSEALSGVDVVIHLAARVHVMRDEATDPLSEFRRVNVTGTEHLARCAAAAGVRRLVYVSSVKVNGESTAPAPTLSPKPSPSKGERKNVFSESDTPAPQDPYGISKMEAEQALQCVARDTGLDIVIVRPPLVYGPGVKGNFAQMLAVLARGIPLPLASVHNQRSLLYVGNLVDALIICASHPAAAGQTYLVSDGADVSTPDLLQRLAAAMGVSPRLFPCPSVLLRLAGKLSGKSEQIERLLGSLQVDSDKIRRDLNWQPPFSLQQGLQATADWYRNTHL